MTRFLYSFILLGSIAVSMFADPIKKGAPVDTAKINKITKECADGFIKAMMTDKAGDALKWCDTPFRRYDGTKLESLESIKKIFDQPPPPGIEVRTGEPIGLSKFNEYTPYAVALN